MTGYSLITWIIVGVFIIDTLILFIYSFNVIILMLLSRKNKETITAQKRTMTHFPSVTIQIPLYNEHHVVKRIIKSAMAIDYPKDRMEIQILDDSTDNTLEISRAIVAEYADRGFQIHLLHRDVRTGYKGGALREGLQRARGEFIAIFDADFIPEKDILTTLLPFFLENKNLGMIQTRWGHLNPDYSPLTKAQSIIIDSHFIVEQTARSANNLFFNFNGTAGLWRKDCIVDAGNWQDDTLTEDCDLSFRAALRDWEFKYVNNIVNKAELPIELTAYKTQQFRWAKGSIQTIKKLGGDILFSTAGRFKKIEAFLHLTYYSVHPLLLLNILFLIPLILSTDISKLYQSFFGSGAFVLSFSAFIPLILFANTIVVIRKNWKKRLLWIPYTIIFGTGLAVNNTIAVFQALWGTQSPFIRTPKRGIMDNTRTRKKDGDNSGHHPGTMTFSGSKGADSYNKKNGFILQMLFELFFALYTGFGIIAALYNGKYIIIPFLLIYFSAFGVVFFLGLKERIKPVTTT